MAIVCACGFGMQSKCYLQEAHSAALPKAARPWLQYKGLLSLVAGPCGSAVCVESHFSVLVTVKKLGGKASSLYTISYPRVRKSGHPHKASGF